MLHVVTAELQETEIRKNLVLQWDGHDRITKIITLIGPGGGASSSSRLRRLRFPEWQW